MSNMHTKSVREAMLAAMAEKSSETAKAVAKVAAARKSR